MSLSRRPWLFLIITCTMPLKCSHGYRSFLGIRHIEYSYVTRLYWLLDFSWIDYWLLGYRQFFYSQFWNWVQAILALLLLFAGLSAYSSKSVKRMRMVAVASVLLLLTYLYVDYQSAPGWWNGGQMGVIFIYNPGTGFFLFPFHEAFLAFLAILAFRLHK